MPKKVKKINKRNKKTVVQPLASTDSCKQIWLFDSIDNDGHFRFSPSREDMDCKGILDKVIQYSKRTWADIKSEKHDGNKSKHHFLNFNGLSDLAVERIRKLQLEERIDQVFSMRMSNELRIIGLRENQFFIVMWFDPKHEFYPVSE